MRLKYSSTAGSTARTDRGLSACGPAAEAHGVTRTVTSRTRRILRRTETVFIAAPWRALHRGLPGREGSPPG